MDGADLGNEPIQADLSVRPRTTNELGELSANRNLLEQIAEATGGQLFLPKDVSKIPGLFQDVSERSSSQQEVTLWDHWLILTLLFGLLTCEWVIRKLNGLP